MTEVENYTGKSLKVNLIAGNSKRLEGSSYSEEDLGLWQAGRQAYWDMNNFVEGERASVFGIRDTEEQDEEDGRECKGDGD